MNELEPVKHEYLDPSVPLAEPEYNNYRVDIGGQRHYVRIFKDGTYKIAPSFTRVKTFCSPMPTYLFQWYMNHGPEKAKWLSTNAMNYGTIFHILCGEYLKGKELHLSKLWLDIVVAGLCEENDIDSIELSKWITQEKRDFRKDLYGFSRWVSDWKVKPFALEYPLFSDLYAGTADIIAWVTDPKSGERYFAMIDIKSGLKGFYQEYEVQLVAYARAWNEEWEDPYRITRIFNYGCHDYRLPLSSRVTPYRIKDQTDTQYAFLWSLWLEIYHKDPKNKLKEFKTDFGPGATIQIEKEPEVLFQEYDVLGREKGESNGTTDSKEAIRTDSTNDLGK